MKTLAQLRDELTAEGYELPRAVLDTGADPSRYDAVRMFLEEKLPKTIVEGGS